MENFFNDEIEKTVFISDEQLKEAVPGKLYGKYFEDTKIYNIFPQELSNKGDFLGELLPAGSMLNLMDFTKAFSLAIKVSWRHPL